MSNFYCKCCGSKFSSISGLTSNMCHKNPEGKYHALYEGSEKSSYPCKYCGQKFNTISGLTTNMCHKNPNGKYHSPAM
jgi:DNA-directed RNA polymerase subunit RPC12/RpoP